MSMAIFTSIPPALRRLVAGNDVGDVYQEECVASWLATGAPVYSLNPNHEIASLRARFPQVEFVATSGEARSPPAVTDLFELMRLCRHAVSIFVNGDIRLNRGPESSGFVATHARDALLVVNRTNITELRPKTAVGMRGAFDIIALPQVLLSEIPVDGFRLGQPWWDYWLPSCALLKGFPVRRHSGQLGFHLKHDIRWNADVMLEQGQRFIAMIEPMLAAAPRTAKARDFARLVKQLLVLRPVGGGDARWIYFLGSRFDELLNFDPIVPAVQGFDT